jgi:hypothetical protein
MDAGCRTGRVTKVLAEKVKRKRGLVYAVDIDSNIVYQVQKNLANFKDMIAIQ